METMIHKITLKPKNVFSNFFNKEVNSVLFNMRTANKLNTLSNLITKSCGLTQEELIYLKDSRKRELVQARQVHMSCLKIAFNLTLNIAGKLYYDKDHSTVLHSMKSVNNELDTNKAFREQYREVFWFTYTINPVIASNVLHIDWMIKP